MLSFSHRRFLTFAAAGALVFTAVSVPARAEELLTHLGPVGPNEPILTAVGSKRVIAFYEPNSGHCAVNAVVWENTSADTERPSSCTRSDALEIQVRWFISTAPATSRSIYSR